mmetsp:Transcript_27790/g.67183  ORF Transcript_27790/g.67183 Transcript_27790/m.67183 type:complete len:582 (+) Transcript_27790:897-2642(+)|eukprot:CAMPEP_0113452902 /NCGR_PEP_ID=MMETSP0014_2-20120614/7083_1 /TAXON_ID=2857 /ORGANISM="Nitzschia sp." /LENGTH=581 /DNA_ID=CAMNT_0000344283 /DNA_START=825 /DNA_END=2570 /DNA_ORIENTATION=+ /assembly_acc=CAM_ASM_000159
MSSREEKTEAKPFEGTDQAAMDTSEVDSAADAATARAAAPYVSSSISLAAAGTGDRSGEETSRRTSDSKEAAVAAAAGATKNEPKGGKGTTKPNKKEKKFPWVLHRIIDEAEQEGNQHIVAWMPNGRSFIVHKRDTFTEQILPRYFRQTKYKSFVRQLNLWGFTYIDQGPDKGSYYCEHFVKGKKELCDKMKRLKTKPSQGGSGSIPSPGMMMMASPGMAPSPYIAGGRDITSALSMHSAPGRSRVGNSSSPSFSAIHSMQQSILFDSLRQQGLLDQSQMTSNESQQSHPNFQGQLQQHEQIPRRYDQQLQLQSQQQQQQQQQLQQHHSAGRYGFSPLQLDTPMIQSHHQLAQNMNLTQPSMFAPSLNPPSSSSVSGPNRRSMNDPPNPQMDTMRMPNNAARMPSQNYMDSQVRSGRAAYQYTQPMGVERSDRPMGFLPNLMDTVGGMTGNTPYTQNTRPMERQDTSGCHSGNSSPDSKSSEMIERIDTVFAPAEPSSAAITDFNKKLPIELEPRHFRSDDFIESSLGGSRHQVSSMDLQWPSSSSTLTKQNSVTSGDERKDNSPRNIPSDERKNEEAQKS